MGQLLQDVEFALGRALFHAANGALATVAGAREASIVVDGMRIPYVRCGKGPPLLLVHGFGDRKETWYLLLPRLSRHFSVIALDLPGFGGSPEVAPDRISCKSQAKFLAAFLDALGLRHVHLCGQSMGGGIAARFAHDYAKRTLSLTLLSAAGPAGFHPQLALEVEAGNNPLLLNTVQDFIKLLELTFAHRPPFPSIMFRYVASRWTHRPAAMRAYLDRMMYPAANEDVPRTVHPKPMPTLVIYGHHERVVHPDNSAIYLNGFPAATSLLLDVGHAPHIEAPGKVGKALIAHIKKAIEATSL